MKKKSSTEVWVTIGLAVFFLIFRDYEEKSVNKILL